MRLLAELREGAKAWGVLQGDCSTHLAKLPDDCVDLCLTSPPYENRRYYDELDFKLKGEQWVAWMLGICKELARISTGFVVVNCQGFTDNYKWSAVPMLLGADLHRAGLHLRNPVVYYRHSVSGSGGPDYFRNDYEWCLVFSKYRRKLPWSDNTACGHAPKWAPGGAFSNRLPEGKRVNEWGSTSQSSDARRPDGKRQKSGNRPSHTYRRVGRPRKPSGKQDEQEYVPPKIANPGNVVKALYTAEDVAFLLDRYGVPGFGDVLHCLVGGGHMGDHDAHDNEAPMSLLLADRFIRSWCPPAGLVYDPFAGSGTTLKAAVLGGRRGFGSDLRPSQITLTRRRMAGVTPELFTDVVKALAIFDTGREDPRRVVEVLARRLIEGRQHGIVVKA